MKKSIIWLIFFTSNFLYAGIQEDLTKAFNDMNFNVNVNDAYAAQSAGHYSGGSLYARAPVRDQQLSYINLPKISAGCGGIDIFMGGFSIINKADAIELAKSVMSNGKGYAFDLALETAAPLISNNMKSWVNAISKATNNRINSCELGTGLVGAVFPKTEESQRNVCQSIAGSKGYLSDYVEARMECAKPSSRQKAFDKAKNEEGRNKELLGSMNFSWQAIKGNSLFGSDKQLAELMMSLSGTVVYQDESSKHGSKKLVLPSLATNSKFISSLMFGGEIDIYSCDEGKDCLNPTKIKDKIASEQSIVKMVEKMLNGIVQKIRSIDTPLNDAEKKFIQSTSLPIYKMLNVQSAYSKGISAFDITQYSEIIASDILYVYLEESIQEVLNSARTLQLPEAEFNLFISNIDEAKLNIRNRKIDINKQYTLINQMINQTMQLEQRLSMRMQDNLKNAMTWSAT
jgi:conjugative transfer pilus assembly protein TraH